MVSCCVHSGSNVGRQSVSLTDGDAEGRTCASDRARSHQRAPPAAVVDAAAERGGMESQ
jgi:hypothetical protein